MIGDREGIIVPAHIEIDTGKLGIACGVGWIGINAPFLVHQTTLLIIDTLTHIAQVIGGNGIVWIKNKCLTIGLNGILIQVLGAVCITNAQV